MPKNSGERNHVPQQDGQRINRPRAQKRQVKDIDWSTWWPFERATGEALKQLNRPQRKPVEEFEDAPL